jgi:hypothetical protein
MSKVFNSLTAGVLTCAQTKASATTGGCPFAGLAMGVTYTCAVVVVNTEGLESSAAVSAPVTVLTECLVNEYYDKPTSKCTACAAPCASSDYEASECRYVDEFIIFLLFSVLLYSLYFFPPQFTAPPLFFYLFAALARTVSVVAPVLASPLEPISQLLAPTFPVAAIESVLLARTPQMLVHTTLEPVLLLYAMQTTVLLAPVPGRPALPALPPTMPPHTPALARPATLPPAFLDTTKHQLEQPLVLCVALLVALATIQQQLVPLLPT